MKKIIFEIEDYYYNLASKWLVIKNKLPDTNNYSARSSERMKATEIIHNEWKKFLKGNKLLKRNKRKDKSFMGIKIEGKDFQGCWKKLDLAIRLLELKRWK